MTTQEQQMLQDLTDRINNTQLPEKDLEAENYLRDTLGRNPDALYILAQTVLVTQYALEQSQKQLADLKAQAQQAQQPKHTTSFLGNLLGRNDEPAPAPPPPPAYTQPGYTPVPNYGPPQPTYYPPQQYGAPQPGYGYGAPQQGGFLRSAMQTATGVAAGALAFEGIESLMHGFGGHQGGYGFEGGGGGRPEEIINNNYYGDSGEHEHSGNLGSDIEDRRNDSPHFADSGNDTFYSDNSDGSNDFGSSDDSGDSGSSNDDSL